MKTLTIMKQKNYRLRSVASGIGALALSALMASAIGGATALAQSAPEITLTPGEYEGRSTLQGTASETVTNWEYLRSSSDFDCGDAIFDQYDPVLGLKYIFVPSNQGDLTYCFRAKANDAWGYAKHRFDFNPPAVTNAQLDSQPGKSTVSLTVSEPVTSRYHVSDSKACSKTSAKWSAQPTGKTVTVRRAQNICFQLTDQSDKVTYYPYKVTSVAPLVKPEVTVSYYNDRDTVEATANKTVNSWAYIVSNQDLGACNQVNYGSPTGRTNVARYTPSKHNQHYYFQGTDTNKQKACGKVIVLAALTNPNPITTTTPTTTTTTQSDAPEIDIDASGRQITASHSEPVAKWRYYRSGGVPICTPDVVWDTEQNSDISKGRQVTGLTDADVGRWVCFRALLLGTAHRGQEVYKSVQITNTWADPTNTQTLTITFQQSPTTLTAIADPVVPSDRFQYLAYSGARYPNGPNCRATNPNMTAEYWTRYNAKTGNVVKLVNSAEGYYYCFRVTDDEDGASYGMYRVAGIRQAAKVKPDLTTTTTVRTLEVRISPTATTLTATTNIEAPGASWQYLVFSGDRYPNGPGCNSDNSSMNAEYWARWETGTSNTVTLKASDEGKFYCFRVVDDNGNAALGQHKVSGVKVAEQTDTADEAGQQEADTTTTVRTLEVRISPTATTLTATTNIEAPGASWQYLVFSGDRYPNGPGCNSDNSSMNAEYWARWETGTSNTVTLKASDEGKFYCFRVVDDNGNAALGQHKVSGVKVAEQTDTADEAGQQEADTTTTTTTTTSETGQDQSATQNTDTVTVTTGTNGNNQAPVVNVDVVNTSPEAPAPQITVNTQAPESQPVPIELTINMPESSTDIPEPEQSEDGSVTQGLLWGLGGAIATLIVLTTILAIVNRGSRH